MGTSRTMSVTTITKKIGDKEEIISRDARFSSDLVFENALERLAEQLDTPPGDFCYRKPDLRCECGHHLQWQPTGWALDKPLKRGSVGGRVLVAQCSSCKQWNWSTPDFDLSRYAARHRRFRDKFKRRSGLTSEELLERVERELSDRGR
jgi:hypothetical protein